MRVELLAALPELDQAAFRTFADAGVDRALKSFLAALGSEDSLFAVEPGAILRGSVKSSQVCSGTFAFKFRDDKLARNRGAYFSLLERLSELLKQAGSAESLTALLSVAQGGAEPTPLELGLVLRLESSGNSPEQAGLRWGLGLAHVQQALLFASRSLRQELTRGAG